MAIRLSDMTAKTAIVTVPWEGEDVEVSYYPNAVTLDLIDSVEAKVKEGADYVAAQLEPIVEWWDVLDDRGKRLPATQEVMRRFPVKFLTAVMRAVTEDAEPGEGTA